MIHSMSKRIRNTLENLGYLLTWIILTILATLTGFQMHATLIVIALAAIQNPLLRPIGWSTQTIYSLSSFLWLVLGILWLLWIMYALEYLKEGLQFQMLKKRTAKLFMITALVYGGCYFVLLLF